MQWIAVEVEWIQQTVLADLSKYKTLTSAWLSMSDFAKIPGVDANSCLLHDRLGTIFQRDESSSI
jgi:hypothetical protein